MITPRRSTHRNVRVYHFITSPLRSIHDWRWSIISRSGVDARPQLEGDAAGHCLADALSGNCPANHEFRDAQHHCANAAKRSFFYGVNFELGYELPQFSVTRWNLEIRPITGVRNTQWEFIANPIVDVGFGSAGEADFAPALRLARNLGEDRFVGLEYYADFGRIGAFLPLRQESQQLFAVTDFKVNTVDVELGVGYGFTPGSDGLVIKTIIGYAFPVLGKSDEDGSSPNTPLAMGTSLRPPQAVLITK